MNWQPIETAPKDGTPVLLWDGEIHEAFWDEIDFSEFRNESIMGWNYGVADIDSSNFRPTFWAELPNFPTREF